MHNPSPINRSAICRYGQNSNVRWLFREHRKVDPNKTYLVTPTGRRVSYEIDGRKYKVLGPASDHDICSTVDSKGVTTYVKIDPKTKLIIDQY